MSKPTCANCQFYGPNEADEGRAGRCHHLHGAGRMRSKSEWCSSHPDIDPFLAEARKQTAALETLTQRSKNWCETCAGSGRITFVDAEGAYLRTGDCEDCHGTGRVFDHAEPTGCPKCGGQGLDLTRDDGICAACRGLGVQP